MNWLGRAYKTVFDSKFPLGFNKKSLRLAIIALVVIQINKQGEQLGKIIHSQCIFTSSTFEDDMNR